MDSVQFMKMFIFHSVFNVNEYNNIQKTLNELEDLLEIKAGMDNENIIEQNSSFIIKDIGFTKNENYINSNNISIDKILFENNEQALHTVE